MKIIFLSNYFNHHQQPFSDAVYQRVGDDYIFLAAAHVEEERAKLGWATSGFPSYVKNINYSDPDDVERWASHIADADIVVGSAYYYKLLMKRMNTNKLTFLYSERLYKSNMRLLKAPLHLYRGWLLRNCYMLCSSAYTSFDYALTRNFINKCYRWGYFPTVKQYDDIESIIDGKAEYRLTISTEITMLWVARFIDWKHPELPIQLALRLKQSGFNFIINMVGVGPLENMIKKLISDNGLDGYVKLNGSKTPEEVRSYMEKSDIYLMTSDRNEGWGAVLNESMNSACAVVANAKIGSVPYLLKDEENGFLYTTESEFFEKVEVLVKNSELRKMFGRNAYRTMTETWNAQTACDNFFKLVDSLSQHKDTEITEGPCSRAEVIYGF